jgi:AcrR family transcriptional regulator
MSRTRAPERLDQIVDAALRTFTAVGYRRARMSDVAAAAGVSPGLLYSYATGKEALFALVVQRESGVDIDALELPIVSPAPKHLTALLRQGFANLAEIPALTLAEKVDAPSDIDAEVAAVVGEHFDGVFAHRTLLRLVERCAIDWPALATSHYEKGRRPHVDRLARYMTRRRDAGYLAAIDNVDIAARFVIETVAWFANHRFGDHDGAGLDDDAVRTEVVALITRSLTGR